MQFFYCIKERKRKKIKNKISYVLVHLTSPTMHCILSLLTHFESDILMSIEWMLERNSSCFFEPANIVFRMNFDIYWICMISFWVFELSNDFSEFFLDIVDDFFYSSTSEKFHTRKILCGWIYDDRYAQAIGSLLLIFASDGFLYVPEKWLYIFSEWTVLQSGAILHRIFRLSNTLNEYKLFCWTSLYLKFPTPFNFCKIYVGWKLYNPKIYFGLPKTV